MVPEVVYPHSGDRRGSRSPRLRGDCCLLFTSYYALMMHQELTCSLQNPYNTRPKRWGDSSLERLSDLGHVPKTQQRRDSKFRTLPWTALRFGAWLGSDGDGPSPGFLSHS